MFNADERLRGPSANSFEVFFATRRKRTHAALFLSICRIVGATPTKHGTQAAPALPGLESGERLCETFEIRGWAPDAEFDFEQVGSDPYL